MDDRLRLSSGDVSQERASFGEHRRRQEVKMKAGLTFLDYLGLDA